MAGSKPASQLFLNLNHQTCETPVSIFYYVTQPVVAAARSGIPVVEINPEETPISDLADFRFVEPAGRTMQAVLEAVNDGSSMS